MGFNTPNFNPLCMSHQWREMGIYKVWVVSLQGIGHLAAFSHQPFLYYPQMSSSISCLDPTDERKKGDKCLHSECPQLIKKKNTSKEKAQIHLQAVIFLKKNEKQLVHVVGRLQSWQSASSQLSVMAGSLALSTG